MLMLSTLITLNFNRESFLFTSAWVIRSVAIVFGSAKSFVNKGYVYDQETCKNLLGSRKILVQSLLPHGMPFSFNMLWLFYKLISIRDVCYEIRRVEESKNTESL